MSGVSGHEAVIRNVLVSAREVRIRLRGAGIVFASVVGTEGDDRESFVVRPWGVPATRRYLFEDVAGATPVRRMGWLQQRAICASQAAELGAPA